MFQDETCHFLAADFDQEGWLEDAGACLQTCRRLDLPAALERSRSGKGGHLWLFFEEAIPANLARKLGSHLLTETMEHRPEIGLGSYDRLFPNQDTLPKGGFGNLIALPLQKQARERGISFGVEAHVGSIVPSPKAALRLVDAVLGHLVDYYAAVSQRKREIGCLLAMGFTPNAIWLAFMAESLLLSCGGALLGCLISLAFNGMKTGTTNWATFSETAFEFTITPEILAAASLLALLMGFIGGVLPAFRAARLKVVDALRRA
jgi:hypothetical protein